MALQFGSPKQSVWLERVRRWQRSQLSVREFCARERLSEPNFYAWRRLLRQRGLLDEGAATPQTTGAAPPTFVPVALESTTASTALEIMLTAGRVIRVRPGFDAATLRQLVRLLEEPSC